MKKADKAGERPPREDTVLSVQGKSAFTRM